MKRYSRELRINLVGKRVVIPGLDGKSQDLFLMRTMHLPNNVFDYWENKGFKAQLLEYLPYYQI